MKTVWLSLGVVFLLQAMIAVVQMTVPVLGPVLTENAGVAPERVGILSSLTFAGSLWFFAVNARVLAPLGAYRALLAGNVLAAIGLLLFLTGAWAPMVLGALLIGVGYGPTPPAGSQILARTTPPERRATVFSIKQSGVPLGAAVAGLLAPAVTLAFGWRAALVVVAGLMFVAVAVVAPLHRRFADRDARPPMPALLPLLSPAVLLEPVRVLAHNRTLIPLSFASASFAVVQGSVFSFLVTFLVNGAQLSLAAAGTAFAALQGGGVVGRMSMGWVADRLGSPRRTLVLLAGASATMAIVLSTIGPHWPPQMVLAVCCLAGGAVASWNGVFLAQIVHAVPESAVGDATAAAVFFTFIGYAVGPVVFGMLVDATGTYDASFATAAGLVAVAGGVLLRATGVPGPRA